MRVVCVTLQVMETKDAAVRDELYEEAQLLRRRQQDYKSELVGLPGRRKVGQRLSTKLSTLCTAQAVVLKYSSCSGAAADAVRYCSAQCGAVEECTRKYVACNSVL